MTEPPASRWPHDDTSQQRPRRRTPDVEVPDRVLDALCARHPLTVLRAPRGYGKTTAIDAWLGDVGAEEDAIVLRLELTEESNFADGFWAEMAGALRGVGVEVRDDLEPQWAVIETLLELQCRLIMVLDNYHEAGLRGAPGAVDDELANIIRQNDQIDLVVATRTYRALETTGTLSVDCVVLGPEELRFSGGAVYRLAAAAGVELTRDEAEDVAVQTAGWPAVIQMSLRRSASENAGIFDERFYDDYLSPLIEDLRYPSVRAFVIRTAVPSRFTADMARAIAPARDPLKILRNLRAAGLLAENATADGRMYSYAPALRSALVRLGRESEPETVRDVHRILMGLSRASGDHVGVLVNAVAAEDYAAALDVIESEWAGLLAYAPTTLMTVAKRFPADIVKANARLRIALEDLEFAPIASDGQWSSDPTAHVAAEVSELLTAPVGADSEEVLALLHWGISALLLGNGDAATYAFNRARTVGLVGGGADRTVGFAAVGIGLSHALEGEPDLALRWLEGPDVWARSQRRAGTLDLAEIALRIARSVALTDMASPRAADAVAELAEPGVRDVLWGVTIYARAHHVVIDGDLEAIARASHDVRAAMRFLAAGTRVESMLAGKLVELLVAMDAVDVAEEVTGRFDTSAIAAVAQARVALARRDYLGTIAHAQKSFEMPLRSWRTRLEGYVLLTSAQHALGDVGRATEAFRHATRMAQGTGHRRPFFMMPSYVFDVLAGDDPVVAELWPASESADLTASQGADLGILTSRELQILRALENHAGPVGIGKELGLSANTVKTHLRAVYRKLGVSSRAEALAIVGSRWRG